jgi:hypothetical protein
VATYSATRTALVAYLRAGYTAMPLYADPTDELTAADEASGWVELAWRPGKKGPSAGRLGPSLTHYKTPFDVTVSIMVPRNAEGDEEAWAAAWAAVDALEALILEAQVGDLSIESVQPVPYDIETGDTHIQIDLQCSGMLESVVEAPSVISLCGVAEMTRVVLETEAPGVAFKDWVGLAAGLWVPVAALETEPQCLGVVSRPPDGTVTIATGGVVDIGAHGWPVGPLWLSQSTSPKGQATGVEPVSGVVKKVAEVRTANEIVLALGAETVR